MIEAVVNDFLDNNMEQLGLKDKDVVRGEKKLASSGITLHLTMDEIEKNQEFYNKNLKL